MQQPKEQVLQMEIAGVNLTVAVDLSALPPSEHLVSLPMRVTAAAKEPFKVHAIHFKLDEEFKHQQKLGMDSICRDRLSLSFGNEKPTLMLAGATAYGITGAFVGQTKVFYVSELPGGMVIFINEHRPNNATYNRVVEYA